MMKCVGVYLKIGRISVHPYSGKYSELHSFIQKVTLHKPLTLNVSLVQFVFHQSVTCMREVCVCARASAQASHCIIIPYK